MIGFAFFISIFSTLTWLIFSGMYIFEKLHGMTISSLGAMDLLIYIIITSIPIFLIWLIFSHINNYSYNNSSSKKLKQLFEQMKRNQDYSDLIARILIECEQNIKSGFAINRFDILMDEMNETISEIVLSGNIMSEAQLKGTWERVKNGEKNALGKAIIDYKNKNPNFQNDMNILSKNNPNFSGAVLEYHNNYQKLITTLEKHDKENIFQDAVETGMLGKTYSILVPIIQNIKKETHDSAEIYVDSKIENKSFFSKVMEQKNKEEPIFIVENFDEEMPAPKIEINEPRISKTEQAMEDLKQEWEDIKKYENKNIENPVPSLAKDSSES